VLQRHLSFAAALTASTFRGRAGLRQAGRRGGDAFEFFGALTGKAGDA
jgi:hypothetical protein